MPSRHKQYTFKKMKIKIIAPGKLKESYIKEGTAEFLKRVQPYCPVEVVEIKPEQVYEESLIEKSLDIEAERILNCIKPESYLITLEINGKQLSSEEFAAKINDINHSGTGELVFVIGSSHGLSDKVSQRADFKLSFSKMTFLHEFARLILTEQIYRAFKIIKNEAYHK